jgi:hypothetical protein
MYIYIYVHVDIYAYGHKNIRKYISLGSGDVSAQIKLNVTDALIGLPQIDHSTVPLKETFQTGIYVCMYLKYHLYIHIYTCIYICIYIYTSHIYIYI